VTINVNLWVQKAAIAVEIATVIISRRSYGTEMHEMWSEKRTKLSLTETESAEWNGMESAEQKRNPRNGAEYIPRNDSAEFFVARRPPPKKAASLRRDLSVRILEQQQQDALAAVETLLNQLSLNH